MSMNVRDALKIFIILAAFAFSGAQVEDVFSSMFSTQVYEPIAPKEISLTYNTSLVNMSYIFLFSRTVLAHRTGSISDVFVLFVAVIVDVLIFPAELTLALASGAQQAADYLMVIMLLAMMLGFLKIALERLQGALL